MPDRGDREVPARGRHAVAALPEVDGGVVDLHGRGGRAWPRALGSCPLTLTRPCCGSHSWFSVQNSQGSVEMTLPSVAQALASPRWCKKCAAVFDAGVAVGLGRIVALYYRSSTSYLIH